MSARPSENRHVVVRGRRVVLPEGEAAAAIRIRAGRIVAIEPPGAAAAGAEDVDAGDRVVLPGGIDVHVHANAPGRTEWEGFETATRAAAAGGVTTIVDMPLNSVPPTTSGAALAAKLAEARGKLAVDVGLWGGVVPGNSGDLAALLDAGALGAKAFLAPSGVPEFPAVGEPELRAALAVLGARGKPLLVHAEAADVLGRAEAAHSLAGSPRSHAAWLASRPVAAEVEAVRSLVRLARERGAPIHVVHLSAADALDDLAEARAEGLPITVETCPHYLAFAAEEIPDGGTLFKCAPPIRERANRERLWEGLATGTVDMVASDHSPCPTWMKRLDTGDFGAAWGGIAGLETFLAALWTEASRRGFGLGDLARWTSAAPARLAGIGDRKGAIAPGRDADLVFWDPAAEFVVAPDRLHYRWRRSAWDGRRLQGVVEATWLRGRPVYDRGAFPGGPAGRVVRRPGDGEDAADPTREAAGREAER